MQTTAKNKITDIEEFAKLFKLNIPIEKEFEYYIKTLKKSQEFDSFAFHKLQDNIDSFIDLEKYISKNAFVNVREYKNQCLDKLKDYILSTNVYGALQTAQMPSIKMVSKDCINQVDEFDMLLSLDFVSANYSVLKSFQVETDDDELEENWAALCEKFNIHKCLVDSKSFRQIVFGNTNPKRLQTFQHEAITELIDFLSKINVTDKSIVFISHDEIIIKIKDATSVRFLIDHYIEIMEKKAKMPIRLTPFSLRKIKKNTFVKTVYDISPSFGDNSTFYFSERYSTLHGVPGNKFYMYFKKYILKEPLDERDLMYYNDGELCRWVDEDAPKKRNLPHYEKPENPMSIKDAMGYSYLWNGMTEILPDMSTEEKRRVIELVSGACKHCFQDDSGCKCWNDD
jgi:hypothetical protein